MKLAVGEVVVYGNHGIARVVARRTQETLGQTQEVVVLELDRLTVTLPVALASKQLRPVANKSALLRVADALGVDVELSSANWSARRRDTLAKLTGGTPIELAQIISEGAQRQRVRSTSGVKAQLSPAEHQLYTRARSLLASEIALSLDIELTAAETWIDDHLPPTS